MSQPTPPAPSQELGTDAIRIRRLEREVAHLKSMHDKDLDDIDNDEAEVQRLKTDLERNKADLLRLAADKVSAKGSDNQNVGAMEEQLLAKVKSLQEQVRLRNSQLHKAAKKKWSNVLPLLNDAFVQDSEKIRKAGKKAAEQATEEISSLREQNGILERKYARLASLSAGILDWVNVSSKGRQEQ